MTRKSNAGFRVAPFSLKVAIMDALRAPGALHHYPEGDYDFPPGVTDVVLAEGINARLRPSVPCTAGMVAHVRKEMFGLSRTGCQKARAAEENKAARAAAAAEKTLSTAAVDATVNEELSHRIIETLNRVDAKLDWLLAMRGHPVEHG